MDKGTTEKLARASLIAGMLLIYPITVIAGPRSLLLLLSSFCVGIDLWSAKDAASNFFQGLLILGTLASLWATLTIPPATMARSRYSFVAAATGLLMVLLMVGFAVRAGLAGQGSGHVQVRFPALWVLGGPALVAVANLFRLIRARNRIGEPKTLSPEPAGVIPRPHLPLAAGHRPVMLVPYRQPQVTRPSPVSFHRRGTGLSRPTSFRILGERCNASTVSNDPKSAAQPDSSYPTL